MRSNHFKENDRKSGVAASADGVGLEKIVLTVMLKLVIEAPPAKSSMKFQRNF